MSEKKRSTYKRGSVGDLPSHVDKTKFAYRWLSANKIAQNSDYHDPRGWELDKDPSGSRTTREDRVLGRMPIDMADGMRSEKEQDRLDQVKMVQEAMAQDNAKIEHEFKKHGGRIKSDFSLTKNNNN